MDECEGAWGLGVGRGGGWGRGVVGEERGPLYYIIALSFFT